MAGEKAFLLISHPPFLPFTFPPYLFYDASLEYPENGLRETAHSRLPAPSSLQGPILAKDPADRSLLWHSGIQHMGCHRVFDGLDWRELASHAQCKVPGMSRELESG